MASRREKAKRKTRLDRAREIGWEYRDSDFATQTDAGNPKRSFRHIDKAKFEHRVLPIGRVSTPKQFRNHDLEGQLRNIITNAFSRDLKVVGFAWFVGNANSLEWKEFLKEQAKRAKELKATLLFESVDRAVRHKQAHQDRKYHHFQPSDADFDVFGKDVGMRSFVMLEPETPFEGKEGVRAYQIKRGKKMRVEVKEEIAKEKYHSPFKRKWFPLARQLSQQEYSLREIAKEVSKLSTTSVNHTTIAYWLRNPILSMEDRLQRLLDQN